MNLDSAQPLNPERLPPKLLKRILRDPALMEKLSDRVYDMLRDDLKRQQERNYGSGRRF